MRTIEQLLVFVLPALLVSQVDLGFAERPGSAPTHQLQVLLVPAQIIAVKFLENLLCLIPEIFQVKVRVVPLHGKNGLGHWALGHNFVGSFA